VEISIIFLFIVKKWVGTKNISISDFFFFCISEQNLTKVL
jgi:hypothetical protein